MNTNPEPTVEPVDIIDTHFHLWDVSRHTYSWCAGVPALNRSFGYSDYLQAVSELPAGFQLVKSVHVEAAPDEKDVENETGWILSLARLPGSLISGIVAGCRPERSDFARRLEALTSIAEVKGLRRVLESEKDELSTTSAFRESISRIGNTRLSFDLCIHSNQLPIAIECVRACPNVRFILDHCGTPDIKDNAIHPWSENLRTLSEFENVVACKLSGLVAYADPSRDLAAQVGPFVHHTIECFGTQRVMFGSDWPVSLLTCSLATWVNLLSELTFSLSHVDRTKLFAGNARRIYQLDGGK